MEDGVDAKRREAENDEWVALGTGLHCTVKQLVDRSNRPTSSGVPQGDPAAERKSGRDEASRN